MKSKYMQEYNRTIGDKELGDISVLLTDTDITLSADRKYLYAEDRTYLLVKTSRIRYYISRGRHTERVVRYKGYKGQGFVILRQNRDSTKYSFIDYYVL